MSSVQPFDMRHVCRALITVQHTKHAADVPAFIGSRSNNLICTAQHIESVLVATLHRLAHRLQRAAWPYNFRFSGPRTNERHIRQLHAADGSLRLPPNDRLPLGNARRADSEIRRPSGSQLQAGCDQVRRRSLTDGCKLRSPPVLPHTITVKSTTALTHAAFD